MSSKKLEIKHGTIEVNPEIIEKAKLFDELFPLVDRWFYTDFTYQCQEEIDLGQWCAARSSRLQHLGMID